jgi:hypothetical protein
MATGATGVSLVDSDHLVVERVEVWLARLESGWDRLRIAQLSDFHYMKPEDGALIRQAVALANSLNPDLIALTGDYITGGYRRGRSDLDACAEILSELRAPLGVFAVLGNHDHPRFAPQALEAQKIAVLRNSALSLERGAARLWITGVEDVLSRDASVDQALQSIPEGEATVLLAHEPDYAETVKGLSVDLQLSGHSHGGQIRVPGVGPLYVPPLARMYPAGMYRLGGLTLYTNRGLGTVGPRLRFNCPPEVTLFTLRSGIDPRNSANADK